MRGFDGLTESVSEQGVGSLNPSRTPVTLRNLERKSWKTAFLGSHLLDSTIYETSGLSLYEFCTGLRIDRLNPLTVLGEPVEH